MATVEYAGQDKIKIMLQPRTLESEGRANDQYATLILNNRLSTILSDIGITPEDISNAELMAGRIGVTDFTKAKNLANDCAGIIRIANNAEGYRALGEEFSHLVIGAFKDDPLVKRALFLLEDPDILKEVLGDEYQETEDFQEGRLSDMAEEALGKLLRENMLDISSKNPRRADYVLNRLYTNIKNKFKKVDAKRIENAIIEADSLMG